MTIRHTEILRALANQELDTLTLAEATVAHRVLKRIAKMRSKGWLPEQVGPCVPAWLEIESRAIAEAERGVAVINEPDGEE